VAHPLELEELVEHFTLYPDETRLLRNKSGATQLGFGLSLKFLLWKARFRGCAHNGTATGDSGLSPGVLPPAAVPMWLGCRHPAAAVGGGRYGWPEACWELPSGHWGVRAACGRS